MSLAKIVKDNQHGMQVILNAFRQVRHMTTIMLSHEGVALRDWSEADQCFYADVCRRLKDLVGGTLL